MSTRPGRTSLVADVGDRHAGADVVVIDDGHDLLAADDDRRRPDALRRDDRLAAAVPIRSRILVSSRVSPLSPVGEGPG